MSSENKDEHAYKAIFTAKSEDVTVEWTAYKTKIMGKARAKNLAAALVRKLSALRTHTPTVSRPLANTHSIRCWLEFVRSGVT